MKEPFQGSIEAWKRIDERDYGREVRKGTRKERESEVLRKSRENHTR